MSMDSTQNRVTERNIRAIAEDCSRLNIENSELKLRVGKLEGELAILKSQIQNSNQLMAHLSGRGMGPTS